MKRANGVFELRSAGHEQTEVTLTMDYQLKFGPLGAVMDKLVMKKFMTRGLHALLAGLDRHLETGEIIGKDWKPARVA